MLEILLYICDSIIRGIIFVAFCGVIVGASILLSDLWNSTPAQLDRDKEQTHD